MAKGYWVPIWVATGATNVAPQFAYHTNTWPQAIPPSHPLCTQRPAPQAAASQVCVPTWQAVGPGCQSHTPQGPPCLRSIGTHGWALLHMRAAPLPHTPAGAVWPGLAPPCWHPTVGVPMLPVPPLVAASKAFAPAALVAPCGNPVSDGCLPPAACTPAGLAAPTSASARPLPLHQLHPCSWQ